jgi:serine/threonine protein kinase
LCSKNNIIHRDIKDENIFVSKDNKMPQSIQPKAKSMIHEMYMAATKEDALKAYDQVKNLLNKRYLL